MGSPSSVDDSTWGPLPDSTFDNFDASTISEYTATRRNEEDDTASRYSKYSLRSSMIHGSFDRGIKEETVLEVDLESAYRAPASDYASHVPEDVLRDIDDDAAVGVFKTSGILDFGPKMYNSIRFMKKKQRRRVGLGCVLLGLIAAIVGVSVAGFGGSRNEQVTLIPPGIDQNAENLNDRQKRFDAIVKSSSDGLAFLDQDSPQSRARQWLIFNDTLWNEAEEEISAERIQQRYVLAVFYFGSGGKKSWSSNWLSGDECQGWEYLDCDNDGKVRAIAFDNAGLTGTISAEIAHLKLLENIIIKNEQKLEGEIPSDLGRLEKLRQLGIYNTIIEGSLPRGLFFARSLVYLNLEKNKLSGSIPLEIQELSELETLNLSQNQMTGNIPWAAMKNGRLRYLNLSRNKFSGNLSPVGELQHLNFLYLHDNPIGGKIPPSIGSANNLLAIDLSNCGLSSHIPPELVRIGDLEYLSLRNNTLHGAIPPSLTALKRLSSLDLSQNELIGGIPDFSGLEKLQKLHLHENRLIGKLQDNLFNMKALTSLTLASNGFSGDLPPTRNKNTVLKRLILSDNLINGNLDSICKLEALEVLMLDDNNIFGELPKCIDKLKELTTFHVSKNYLEGNLPDDLSKLKQLVSVGLEGNSFIGNAGKICDLSIPDLWSDCGGNAPELVCNCCSVCCAGNSCLPNL